MISSAPFASKVKASRETILGKRGVHQGASPHLVDAYRRTAVDRQADQWRRLAGRASLHSR